MRDLILTAADPTTEGLSVVTREELARREREADAKQKQRALDAASEVLNRDRRITPRRWSPVVALVLSLLGACDQPPLKRKPQDCSCTCSHPSQPDMARPLVAGVE